MTQGIESCLSWIAEGERGLCGFEERLFLGDLDGATDILRDAWRNQLKPLTVLSNCWEGSFWSDWHYRKVLEKNIINAQEMLLRATAGDLEDVLLNLKDLMLANFYLLRRAVALLCADIRPSAAVIAHDIVQ